jgi:hypothetical protein
MTTGCAYRASFSPGGQMIKIAVTSVLVDDQAKALRFYTEVLGFVKRTRG